MKTVGVRLEWREEEGKVFVGISFWSKIRLNKLVSSKRLWSSLHFTQEVDCAEVAGDSNQWEKV